MRTKERTYEILEGHRRDRATDITNLMICGLIGLNLAVFTFSTVESVYQSWSGLFDTLESVSVVVFSAEYAMRLWSCTSDEKYSAPVLRRLRFAARPLIINRPARNPTVFSTFVRIEFVIPALPSCV